MKKTNQFNKSPWDPLYSSFMQVIEFKSGKTITGWSKKVDFAERKNKDDLLCNMILRMYIIGYLDPDNPAKDPINFIEYYDMRYNRADPNRIMRLYYSFPEFEPDSISKYKVIADWVNKFYDLVNQKIEPEIIYKKMMIRSKRRNEEDPLRIEGGRFSNPSHLSQYCLYLMENSIRAKGEVEHFYRGYMNKVFKK